jgi:hypothetical protein
VFTARYALSPYIKQIRFVFKGLMLRDTYTDSLVLYSSCEFFVLYIMGGPVWIICRKVRIIRVKAL